MIGGIDIGLTGGLAFLSEDPMAYRMPVLVQAGKTDYDIHEAIKRFSLSQALEPFNMVVIERAGFRPEQHVRSASISARGQAIFEVICQMGKIPYILVSSQKWKSDLNLLKSDKKASISMARSIYPKLVESIPKGGPIDGPCEAILIAHWYAEHNAASLLRRRK